MLLKLPKLPGYAMSRLNGSRDPGRPDIGSLQKVSPATLFDLNVIEIRFIFLYFILNDGICMKTNNNCDFKSLITLVYGPFQFVLTVQ